MYANCQYVSWMCFSCRQERLMAQSSAHRTEASEAVTRDTQQLLGTYLTQTFKILSESKDKFALQSIFIIFIYFYHFTFSCLLFLNSQDQVEAEFEAFKAELKVLHQLKDKIKRYEMLI